MPGRHYRMAARDVPVVLEVDVVVVGDGFPGVCAAVAAARAGAKVVVIERDGMLGGQAAEIYTFGLDAVFGDAGIQIIKGLPWEILQRTAALGDADPSWSKVDFELLKREGYDAALAPLGMNGALWQSSAWLERNALRQVMRSMCDEEGVTVVLESPLSGAMLDGDRVTGVIAQGSYGPFAVAGATIVDATPYAGVAAAAGHPFAHPEVYLGTHPHVSPVQIQRLIEFACEHPDDVVVDCVDTPTISGLLAMIERGVPLLFRGFSAVRRLAARDDPAYEQVGMSDDKRQGETLFFYTHQGRGTYWLHSARWRKSRLDDPLHFSQCILGYRRLQWITHQMFQHYVPGFEHARLDDVHPHIARTFERSFDPSGFTDYNVTLEDIQNGGPDRDDLITRVMGHPRTGQPDNGWLLPYAAMLPKGLEGLLVTGKPVCRSIHYHGTVGAVGHAAGVAAARGRTTPRQTSAAAIRDELRRQGAVAD